MTDLRTAAQQALEACEQRLPLKGQAAIIDELNNLRAALAQQAEPTRSQQMVAAGFKPRDRRLECDECGGKFTAQMLPIHKCAQQAELVQDQRCRAEPRSDGDFVCDCKIGECLERSAALARQAEPVAGKVVAWGVFANIDGEWQLQHPVFAGDEQGKANAEFERASYSGPQPLEVRPLGVVTATAQQAEPVEPVAWALDGTSVVEFDRQTYHNGPEWTPLCKCADTPPQRKPLTEEVATLTAQRDALLELLKLARSIIGHPDDAHTQMIDAVIKAVEEGK